MRNPLITLAAVALSAVALTVGSAGAVHAEAYGQQDPKETSRGFDVRKMHVKLGELKLRVTTTHQNLRPSGRAGGLLYIDTDPDDRGPEYVLVGGYFEGTDYALVETEGFGHEKFGDHVLAGSYALRINYEQDKARAIISRTAIGDANEVRISYRASGKNAVDWMGKPRSFTPWIAKG